MHFKLKGLLLDSYCTWNSEILLVVPSPAATINVSQKDIFNQCSFWQHFCANQQIFWGVQVGTLTVNTDNKECTCNES